MWNVNSNFFFYYIYQLCQNIFQSRFFSFLRFAQTIFV
jgi:hypothetical protein